MSELAKQQPFEPKKAKTISGKRIVDVDFGEETRTLTGPAANRVRLDLLSLIGSSSETSKDDLKAINGIGEKLESMLNDMGIFTYEQISRMGKVEYDLLDSLLPAFKGRARRDDWSGQASAIMTGSSYSDLFEEE